MKNLEDFLRPTQRELFDLIRMKYRGKAEVHIGNYILVPGKAPIMLIAHLDTVHEKPVKYICKSCNGNILMSPQGIGGDDRCGVYALVKAHEAAPIKPWLLFTCNEEVGGLGAEKFVMDYSEGKLPKHLGRLPKELNTLKLLVEIDRKGSNDAVYYGCDNPEFEAYITSKGFRTANGSFSDISVIAPEMGIAAVNLSSGYYNAHTLHEYINREQIDAVIQSVVGIIADAAKPDFPKYEYIERTWFDDCYSIGSWSGCLLNAKKVPLASKHVSEETVPSDLSSELIQMYSDLLDLYAQNELEWYRKEYGDQIISQLYYDEFGPCFDIDGLSRPQSKGIDRRSGNEK